eukprot:COSAG06_NODE_22839_length_711_cov_0.838235_1_plen_148_part_10
MARAHRRDVLPLTQSVHYSRAPSPPYCLILDCWRPASASHHRYIVIEGVLTSEEVDEINDSIDHHIPLLNAPPSGPMGGRTPAMIGDRNVHTLIAEYLNAQRGLSLTAVDVMDQLQQSGFPATGRTLQFGQALSAEERQAIVVEMKAR